MSVITKIKNINWERVFFYTIILLFPINLGIHFVQANSYINGVLVDYLIPTVFLQDIIIFGFLVSYWKSIKLSIFLKQKYFIWFIAVLIFSLVYSEYKLIGLLYVVRMLLYFLFMLYAKSNLSKAGDKTKFMNIIFVSAAFLCILSIFQWIVQGSVFDNYLFFGEQPYSAGTPGINVENFFGVAKIPPYATFRHPNILGGILSIILVWLASFLKKGSIFHKALFILVFIVLFLSLSIFSWVCAVLGLSLLLFDKKFIIKSSIIAGIFIFWATSFFLPYITGLNFLDNHPSFYRRSHLLSSSYRIIQNNFWFGTGPGAATSQIDKFMTVSKEIRFTQPPHNMYILIFVEAGVFAFLLFIGFFFSNLAIAKRNNLFLISLLQVMFLSSVDHYFLSMHQALFFLFAILGFI